MNETACNFIAASSMTIVAVVATTPAAADPFEAAIVKHRECVVAAVVALDDKTSPADVIALAAEQKCRSIIVAECRLGPAATLCDKAGTIDDLIRQFVQRVTTETVLRNRLGKVPLEYR